MSPQYADLLSRISYDTPRNGYSLGSLPRLTDVDLADCLAQQPGLLDDVIIDAQTLGECLMGAPIAGGVTADEFLGIVVRAQLASAAKRMILDDLREREADREVAAYEASVQAVTL